MSKKQSDPLRNHVLELLEGRNAHVDLEGALAGLPANLRGAKPDGTPHTIWQLLEHIRIAQWDILEFSRNPKHVSPKWPEGHWPKTEAPPSAAAWNKSIKQVRDDMKAMAKLVSNKKNDLFAPFAWGDGQTLLREALLVADHNAYHAGQIVLLRKLLGAWKE
jgi:DinB superfamily